MTALREAASGDRTMPGRGATMSDLEGGGGNSRRLVFWRHGRTTFNVECRFQGQLDSPLDDVGEKQAAVAADELATLEPMLLVSSDLCRATATAAVLGRACELPVVTDRRLREDDVGAWQGLTYQEVAARFPEAYATWLRGGEPEGWEPFLDLGRRAAGCLMELLAEVPAGGTVVAVSHGGTIRAAIGVLLGLDRSRWSIVGPLGNCSWSVLAETGSGWRLAEHNASVRGDRFLPSRMTPTIY